MKRGTFIYLYNIILYVTRKVKQRRTLIYMPHHMFRTFLYIRQQIYKYISKQFILLYRSNDIRRFISCLGSNILGLSIINAFLQQNPTQTKPVFPSQPALVPHNPRLAEQMAKRKLLWSGGAKKATNNTTTQATEPAAAATAAAPLTRNSWETVEFAQDSNGAQASKFLRLMGMKNATGSAQPAANVAKDPAAVVKRAQMFSEMERQYETARKTTHNIKGKGFGSAGPVAQKKYF